MMKKADWMSKGDHSKTTPEVSKPLKLTVYICSGLMLLSVLVGGVIMVLNDGDWGVMQAVKILVGPLALVMGAAGAIIAVREARAKRTGGGE